MRKTFGIVTTIAAILIVIFLFLPFFTGFWLKDYDNKYVSHWAGMQPNTEIKTLAYHRGWFHSSADTEVVLSLNDPLIKTSSTINTKLTPFSFQLHSEINHGPFFYTTDDEGTHLHFGFGSVHTVFVEPKLPIVADTQIDFNHAIMVVKSDKATLELSNLLLKTNGLMATISHDLPKAHTQFHYALNELNATVLSDDGKKAPESQVNLIHIMAQGDVESRHILSLGDVALNIEQAQFLVKDEKNPFIAHQLKLNWYSHIENNQLAIGIDSLVNQVELQGTNTGPYHLNYNLSKMDVPTIEQTISALQTQPQPKNSPLKTLLGQFTALAEKGLKLTVDVGGDLSQDQKVNLVGQAILAPTPDAKFGLFSMLGQLSLQAHVTVPTAFLESYLTDHFAKKQTDQQDKNINPAQLAKTQVQTWIDQGRLQAKGPNLSSEFSFAKGQLLVNGAPLKLF